MASRFLICLWLAACWAPTLAGQEVQQRNLLSQDLPKWLEFKFTMRTRMEQRGGLSFPAPFDDGFALNRARFDAEITPSQSWRVHFQLQDSRSLGLADGRSRTGTDDPIDFRQFYLEAGAEESEQGWRVRLGRQLLIFGGERIIAERNWNNVAPGWDGARVGYVRGEDGVDVFAAAQVEADPDDVDPALAGSRIGGFSGTIGSVLPGSRIEPYWFFNERPRIGGVVFERQAGIHTFGARAMGELTSTTDYGLEWTGQRGHAPGLRQRGWSGYSELGVRPWDSGWQPRFFGIYEYASGDADPGDGVVGTFDSGLGKRHSHLGAADAVGRSNLRNFETGVEAAPGRTVLLRLAYHNFRVASRTDAVYRTNGLLAVAPPEGGATASRIGDEVDLILEWAPRKDWSLEGGLGLFFAGPFLEQALEAKPGREILYLSFEWSL